MLFTKKYVLDKINSRRNALIEISGLIRNMLTKIDKSIKKREAFPLDELNILNSKIREFRKNLDGSNIKIVIDSELKEEDLRLIIGGMKMVSNLEKISSNIINITTLYNTDKDFDHYNNYISVMIDTIFLMFDSVFVGFIYREIDNCYEVINEDKTLDNLKRENKKHIEDLMMKDEILIDNGIKAVEIISSLERIGDYIVNIAEDIVFIFSGEDIRYNN